MGLCEQSVDAPPLSGDGAAVLRADLRSKAASRMVM